MALPNKTKIPVGTVLAGKYRITREIGRGGMATVHEAENVDIGKRVAIKVLAQELTGSSIVVERFLREARAAAAIRSPYICDVYDSGKLPSGQPFLVLELLEGESLYERMTRQRQLDPATTIAVITQVCRGLTKAHAASIVHRDLKPENIFLTKDEEGQLLAKILDFGLAKFYTPTTKDQARLTREGAVFGTPAYMSPEQVRGQGAVDHRADLWALGCITYECFTGKTVWSTDQGVAMTFAQIASAALPRPARYRPDLPQAFTEWFDRTLDRDINKRFQTAKEFAETLAAAFGREASEIRPAPVEARAEAAAASANAPTVPPSAPPRPAAGQPAVAPTPASASPPALPPGLDQFAPIGSDNDEDGDPTRVLSKRPQAKAGGPDARMERFRRTPDGKIAKVVPQVAPNAPPVPAAPRPPGGPATPVPPRPGPAAAPVSQRSGQAASPSQRPPPPATPVPPRPAHAAAPVSSAPRARSNQDSELERNPFANARRTRRLALVITLIVLAVLVVVFVVASSPPSGSGDSGATSGASGEPSAETSASAATSTATATPAPPPAPKEAPLPGWLADVRDAQGALASGDSKAAGAKLGQAATKSNQHAAAQGLVRQVGVASWVKGACSLVGLARPRTYDMADPSTRRVTATSPSIVAAGGGALAAWTDAHTGASHAYVVKLDGSFALADNAVDLTPTGGEVRGVELFAWGDKVVAVYTETKAPSAGTYARWLGGDGKPTGEPVRVGPPKSAQGDPLVFGAPGKLLGVAWADEGDRDSEDLFVQKLSATGLAPEGAPIRVTDFSGAGAGRARVLSPRGAATKDALHFAYELERRPATYIEHQAIEIGELGRELAAAGANREGKAAGSLTLANVDKGKAHAAQIGCSAELCFVVWHGESGGAQGAAFDAASGRALWRRKFSSTSAYPAAAAGPGGGLATWIEDGKLVAAQLGRAGFGKAARLARASAGQPLVDLAAGPDKGQFFAVWLDTEGSLLEPYAAKLRCP